MRGLLVQHFPIGEIANSAIILNYAIINELNFIVLKLRVSALDAERLVSSYQAIQGRPAKTQANS